MANDRKKVSRTEVDLLLASSDSAAVNLGTVLKLKLDENKVDTANVKIPVYNMVLQYLKPSNPLPVNGLLADWTKQIKNLLTDVAAIIDNDPTLEGASGQDKLKYYNAIISSRGYNSPAKDQPYMRGKPIMFEYATKFIAPDNSKGDSDTTYHRAMLFDTFHNGDNIVPRWHIPFSFPRERSLSDYYKIDVSGNRDMEDSEGNVWAEVNSPQKGMGNYVVLRGKTLPAGTFRTLARPSSGSYYSFYKSGGNINKINNMNKFNYFKEGGRFVPKALFGDNTADWSWEDFGKKAGLDFGSATNKEVFAQNYYLNTTAGLDIYNSAKKAYEDSKNSASAELNPNLNKGVSYYDGGLTGRRNRRAAVQSFLNLQLNFNDPNYINEAKALFGIENVNDLRTLLSNRKAAQKQAKKWFKDDRDEEGNIIAGTSLADIAANNAGIQKGYATALARTLAITKAINPTVTYNPLTKEFDYNGSSEADVTAYATNGIASVQNKAKENAFANNMKTLSENLKPTEGFEGLGANNTMTDLLQLLALLDTQTDNILGNDTRNKFKNLMANENEDPAKKQLAAALYKKIINSGNLYKTVNNTTVGGNTVTALTSEGKKYDHTLYTDVNTYFKNGGTMTNKYQQGGAAPQQDMQAQVAQLVQAAMSGDLKATQTINKIMEAAKAGDQLAMLIALMILAVAQQMQGQAPAAKYGAKLSYIHTLSTGCPEGTEAKYFKKGGHICKACVEKAKKAKAQEGAELEKCGGTAKKKKCENGGYFEYFKCGGKKKKAEEGAVMEKCGGKTKKAACGAKTPVEKCGSKAKKKCAEGGVLTIENLRAAYASLNK